MNILLAFVLFTAYTAGLCILNKKIPSSLSQSVYFLPHSNSWVWTLVVFALILLLLVPFGPGGVSIAEKAEGWTVVPLFFALAMLGVVGVAPLSSRQVSSIDYTIHIVAAWSCAVLCNMVVMVNQPWLLTGWIPWAVAFVCITKDNALWRTAIFWAEITVFIIIIVLGIY